MTLLPPPPPPTGWVPWGCHSFAYVLPLLRAAFPIPHQLDHHPTWVDLLSHVFPPGFDNQPSAVDGCLSLTLVVLASQGPPVCHRTGHCAQGLYKFSFHPPCEPPWVVSLVIPTLQSGHCGSHDNISCLHSAREGARFHSGLLVRVGSAPSAASPRACPAIPEPPPCSPRC